MARTLRATEGFTTAGAEKGLAMLLNTLAELVDARMLRGTAKADLDKSLQQAYDLYHALLYMPVLITDLAGAGARARAAQSTARRPIPSPNAGVCSTTASQPVLPPTPR